MAKTGRTYSGRRSPSYMTSEARRLREVVQEQEEKIERLRSTLSAVRRGLEHIAERTESTATRQDAVQGISEIDHALDGGGDAP